MNTAEKSEPVLEFCATPYSIDAPWFYFSTFEQWEKNRDIWWKKFGVDEFELQFINGNEDQCNFARLCPVHEYGHNVGAWIEDCENFCDLYEYEQIAFEYLMKYASFTDAKSALQVVEDIYIFQGTLADYAQDYLESCGYFTNAPELLAQYFDFEAFGRDCRLNGDWFEFVSDIDSNTYVIGNSNTY